MVKSKITGLGNVRSKAVAVVSYYLLMLLVVSFSLYVMVPSLYTSIAGRIALAFFTAASFYCGRFIGFMTIFVLGTLVIYTSTIREGIEGQPPAPSKIDPFARGAPENISFLSINESGDIIASALQPANDGSRTLFDNSPVPMADRDPYVWSYSTQDLVKEFGKKFFPGVEENDFYNAFSERYQRAATDEEVIQYLTNGGPGSPYGFNLWSWDEATTLKFQRVAGPMACMVTGLGNCTHDVIMQGGALMTYLSRHQLTQKNVEVLMASSFLFEKWISYFAKSVMQRMR